MKSKINLIPNYRKKEIHQQNVFLKIMRWNFEFTAVYLAFIIMLFVVGYILKLDLEINLIQLNPNNIARFNDFKEEDGKIKTMNDLVGKTKKIQEGQLNWTKFLYKLEMMLSEGIVLEKISTKDTSIFLAGNSNTSDNLIIFKEAISKDSCFSNIELPLSYVVNKENVDFQMTFNFDKNCLKIND